jgi:pyrroloquinoline quinone biosynthesis protein B
MERRSFLGSLLAGLGPVDRRRTHKIGHPPIRESMRILKNLPPDKKACVYFTHFNHSNLALDPEGNARREIEREGFRMASLGTEFPLST